MKYSNGIWSAICRMFRRMFPDRRKAENYNVSKHLGSKLKKRMYYTGIGNIGQRVASRSSQSKRRKMERRVGYAR